MSSQELDPKSSVYLPRVPTKPPTERYERAPLTHPALSQDERHYIWNRPSDVALADRPLTKSKDVPAASTTPDSVPSIECVLEQRLLAVEKFRREAAGGTPSAEESPKVPSVPGTAKTLNTPNSKMKKSPRLLPPVQEAAPTREQFAAAPIASPPLSASLLKGHPAPSISERLLRQERLAPRVSAPTSVSASASAPAQHITIPAPIRTIAKADRTPLSPPGDAIHPPQSVPAHTEPSIPSTEVWGIRYHALTMEQTLDEIQSIIERRIPSVAITANLNYSMLCDRYPRLLDFTQKAALVLCDGKPIQWRSLLTKLRLPERVAGSDLIYRLAELSQKTQCSIYLYGAAEGVAEKAANILKTRYPGCIIAGVQCPPYQSASPAEKQRQLDLIREANPDILLVALGQPKGEFWIEENLEQLGVPLAIQVGASFDFVTGNAKRAPKFMQKLGAEWLYRMLTDPRRLAPRYLKNAFYLLKVLRKECIDALETNPKKLAKKK